MHLIISVTLISKNNFLVIYGNKINTTLKGEWSVNIPIFRIIFIHRDLLETVAIAIDVCGCVVAESAGLDLTYIAVAVNCRMYVLEIVCNQSNKNLSVKP